ncbi:MAG: cyclic nucleotide-binding domain-containing protein [Actinobacteria bacterium]|nr:cyclic nucleotide-binding domain-containing protein [Actinomycetota bacterium]
MLARNPLFEGVSAEALEQLEAAMRRRTFAPREVICRAGEPGDSLFVVLDGFARVSLPAEDGGSRVVARLRRGDIVGEMSLVTGEPRTATVTAAVPTTALELSRDAFAGVVAREPRILQSLTRILSERLAATTAQVVDARARGEAIALIVGDSAAAALSDVLAATEAASPRPVVTVDARASLEPLAGLDELLSDHGTVLVLIGLENETAPPILDGVDRVLALVSESERGRLVPLEDDAGPLEVVPLGADGRPADVAWLGRHLSRTKLGLALGAGGAKGYSHVGVLSVLEEAGYTVDYVSGSSIGAIVGAWIALGHGAAEIEAAMRDAFRPEIVEDMFKLSMTGGSTGLETMTRLLRETTDLKTFADLVIPLVVMTVDLNAREAAPVTQGPLWEALLAATALAGLFPPREQNGRRLVDGLALVPVPSDAVREAGADVTVSVNIISRETLPAWPGSATQADEQRKARPARMLDTLLEVMDLAQLDSSEQHAARADVPITPRFGPSTWRDFHLADLFLEAGRVAARERLPALASLARPQSGHYH